MSRAQSDRQVADDSGFTIVELLISLAVFSFVLITITVAFIQIFASYNTAIYRKTVNDNARAMVGDITTVLREVSSPSVVNTGDLGNGRLCIGGTSYVWNAVGAGMNNKVNGKAVNVDKITNDAGQACITPGNNVITSGTVTSIFNSQVGIQTLTLTQLNGVQNLYKVNLTATTNNGVYLNASGKCKYLGSAPGAQYCAQVNLSQVTGLLNE
ncbi:MAG TPA: prepilin-type N-terminal cleavage/methylation domain-containing protein [Candidatus Saccharimonadales bacterium]|nr:prepilin-type N-terminal cleavage/methylation domain-containing protein [Candidatus Saccharimonadales bacterium]